MILQQYRLTKEESTMTCWLEANRAKVGDKVTLKDSEDPDAWWTIAEIFAPQLDKSQLKGAHNSKGWHKNDYHGRLKGDIAQPK